MIVVAGSGRLADKWASYPPETWLLHIIHLKEDSSNITRFLAHLIERDIDGNRRVKFFC